MVSETVRQFVRERARSLCEYCHTSEQWQYVLFTIDHIISPAEGGSDHTDNLALACFHCNRRKSNHQTAIDPASGVQVPLFHPRQDSWQKHFIWSDDTITVLGITATGRATVDLLQMNRTRIQLIRSADIEVGRHPPDGDPIVR